MKTQLFDLSNKKIKEITLPASIFGIEPRKDILFRMVNFQMAKRRQGTHKTKGISDISGTTKKPWRQKGTGRARAGSLRDPQFRGGATIFGPVVRSHAHDLPKKLRKTALKMALSTKFAEGKLLVVQEMKTESHKTKNFTSILSSFGLQSALFIDGTNVDQNFMISSRNLHKVAVMPQQGANVRDILKHDHLVLSLSALEQLEERLQ